MTTKRQKFDDDRYDLELQQMLADIKLKNVQKDTEIWKVVLLTFVATAALFTAISRWPQIFDMLFG